MANDVERVIEFEAEAITPVPKIGKPARVFDHDVKFIAMQNKEFSAVRGLVNGFMHDLNGAKIVINIVPGEFIVIAGNENHPGSLSRFP